MDDLLIIDEKDSKEQCSVDLDFKGISNQILFFVKIGELGGAGRRAKELGFGATPRFRSLHLSELHDQIMAGQPTPHALRYPPSEIRVEPGLNYRRNQRTIRQSSGHPGSQFRQGSGESV